MAQTSGAMTPNTIVLIHGLWMTPRSWEKWIERYSSRGHHVLAPSWPGMEADPSGRHPGAVGPIGVCEDCRTVFHMP